MSYKLKDTNVQELDTEWIHLMKEAMDSGLSVEKVREFLNHSSKNKSKIIQIISK